MRYFYPQPNSYTVNLFTKEFLNIRNIRKYPRELLVLTFAAMWLYEVGQATKEGKRADRCEERSNDMSDRYRIQDSTKMEIYRRQDSIKYERAMDMAAQNAYKRIFKPSLDSLKSL